MKKQNGLFWLCFAGTVLLALGVIYLPRYISRSLDLRSMGQVELAGRDNFSFLEAGSNDLQGVVRAFQSLEKNGEKPVLITSIEDPEQISRELLEHIYIEANAASQYGMFPWLEIETGYEKTDGGKVPVYMDWFERVKYARYYSLTCESEENPNKKEMLNLWYVRFSDDERFDYSFVVNAITYEIYYAEIYNLYTERMVEDIEQIRRLAANVQTEEGAYDGLLTNYGYGGIIELGEVFSTGCRAYYDGLDCEYVNQTGQWRLNRKVGVIILYCMENEELGTVKNVYIDIKAKDERHVDGLRGISIGFQELSGWAQDLQE